MTNQAAGMTRQTTDVGYWAELLAMFDLPVLANTRSLIREMAEDPRFSLKDAGSRLMRDPGLALKIMRLAGTVQQRHFKVDPVNLNQAAMLLGIGKIREASEALAVIEDHYPPHVQSQLRRLYGRSVYTAMMAEDWARRRHDIDPDEVALGALLNSLGGLVLWAALPDKMERLTELKEQRGALPHEAEYVVLGFGIERFGHELACQWKLPQLVREGMEAKRAQESRTLGVIIAVQICRAAAYGWRGADVAENVRLAADYLGLDDEAFAEAVNGVTEDFNAIVDYFGLPPLPPLEIDRLAAQQGTHTTVAVRNDAFCLAPRSDTVITAVQKLSRREVLPSAAEDLLAEIATTLHDGLGLNRVVLAVPSADGASLTGRAVVGADYEPAFNRFRVPLREGQLFTLLMQKPAAFWLNDKNREGALQRIPRAVRELIGVESFYAMSIFVHGKPYALAYADRRSDTCALDARSFESFKRLVVLATRALEQIIPPSR